MRIQAVAWDHPDSAALRGAQRDEIAERYGDNLYEPGVHPSAADITVLYVAYGDGDRPLGCGALRLLGNGEAEIKRMYVTPDARGTGAATAILRALEDDGRARGLSRLVLETGSRLTAAMRFYEREGYVPIPRFGPYTDVEDSRCYARAL